MEAQLEELCGATMTEKIDDEDEIQDGCESGVGENGNRVTLILNIYDVFLINLFVFLNCDRTFILL